jgi:hypothetical protein
MFASAEISKEFQLDMMSEEQRFQRHKDLRDEFDESNFQDKDAK